MKKDSLVHFQAWLIAGLLAWSIPASVGTEFADNLDKTFTVKSGGKISLRADSGSITVTPGSDSEVVVRVFRKTRASNQEKANTAFSDHEVVFGQEGDVISVTAKNLRTRSGIFSGNRPNAQVSFQISVPKKFAVDLHTAGGDIQVGDLDGQAIARTSSGSIKLKSVTGRVDASNSGGDIFLDHGGSDVRARTSSGSILLKTVSGDVQASNSGGDITLNVAGGNADVATSSGTINLGVIQKEVMAKNSGGDITLAEAGGKADLRTSSGSIRIKNVKGPAEARNSGGDITVEQASDSVHAETSSGSIKLTHVKGDVLAGNSGGDITVEEIGGNADLHTSSGSIRLGRVEGTVLAKNSGGDISIHAAKNSIQANTSSGTINVRMAQQPKGPSRFEVSGGGIKLALANGLAASVDARASGGRIVTEMPVTMTLQGEQKEEVLAGKINGGGPEIVLRASSGNIVIQTF